MIRVTLVFTDRLKSVQGAVATWRLWRMPIPQAPGRYSSLYRTERRISKR